MCGIGAGAFKGRRFAYLSGPAPVEQILREMQAGMFSYFGTNYMKQFLQLIDGCDAQADIVAWHFRQEVNGVKRNDTVTYHGFCEPSRIKAIISRAHVSVAATRCNFEVGFEMTCCEASLCGGPLTASTVCAAFITSKEHQSRSYWRRQANCTTRSNRCRKTERCSNGSPIGATIWRSISTIRRTAGRTRCGRRCEWRGSGW